MKILKFLRANYLFMTIFFLGLFIFYLTRSSSFDDWDSAQFAMAIRDYDITKHQPHPPGFPVYIFLVILVNYYLDSAVFIRILKEKVADLILNNKNNKGFNMGEFAIKQVNDLKKMGDDYIIIYKKLYVITSRENYDTKVVKVI